MSGTTKSRKFGTYEDLSEITSERISKVIDLLDSKDYEYDIYFGYPIVDEKNNKDFVKGIIISVKGITILFENEKEKNAYTSRLFQLISTDTNLFTEIMANSSFIKYFDLNNPQQFLESYCVYEDCASQNTIKKANRAIQTAYALSKEDEREVKRNNTLGAKIKRRNTFIGAFDEKQFNMIHAHNEKNLRIRGLAGSGKTILLVKKMAYLHYKYPDKNIAFVFYTLTLKQYIYELFLKYYKDYNRYTEPNMNKIHISHCWGSLSRKGFYSDICSKVDYTPKSLNEAKYEKKSDEDVLEYVCKDLLEHINTSQIDSSMFDYIFIDEAQDFKLHFFKMARKVLNPSGKLIYAYDELQALNDENAMPTKAEIFQDEECIDINLETSYRAPVEILTTAHALGLGMYRDVPESETPFVNILRDKDVWIDIGYKKIEGELEYGKPVVLRRTEERLSDDKLINTYQFENEAEQYKEASKIIIGLLKNEDILPEDILIIDLSSYKIADNHATFRRVFNNTAKEEEYYDESTYRVPVTINLVNKDNPTRMKIDNAIPYTTIYRAKGNEANLVFILNSDILEAVKSVSRNKIFTAMTRARYAVWLMGMSKINMYRDEIQKVKDKDYSLDFTYPTKEQLLKIKTHGEKESVSERKMSKVISGFNDLSKLNPELAKQLLQEMLKDVGGKNE